MQLLPKPQQQPDPGQRGWSPGDCKRGAMLAARTHEEHRTALASTGYRFNVSGIESPEQCFGVWGGIGLPTDETRVETPGQSFTTHGYDG